jgi:hypothetical protein
MNIEGQENIPQGAAPEAQPATEAPATPNPEFVQLQQQNQELQSTIQSLQEKVGVVDKLASVFGTTKEEPKPVYNEVTAENAQSMLMDAYQKGTHTEQELQDIKEFMNTMLSEKEAQTNYQTQQNIVNRFLPVVGDGEEDWQGLLEDASEVVPDIELGNILNEGITPKNQYQVRAAIAETILARMLEPNNDFAKTLQERVARNQQVRQDSTFNGQGFDGTGGSGESDGSVSFTPIEW